MKIIQYLRHISLKTIFSRIYYYYIIYNIHLLELYNFYDTSHYLNVFLKDVLFIVKMVDIKAETYRFLYFSINATKLFEWSINVSYNT